MLNDLDYGRLVRLMNDLHLCTGVKFALLNDLGQEIYTSSYRTDFCAHIMAQRADRCHACDRHAVETVLQTHRPYRYICHAGLYEVAIPVLEQGTLIAIILFGQLLDDAPREDQWQRILQSCAWENDTEGLHQAFLRLKRISPEQMNACAEIAQACVSEVRLRSMSHLDTTDDATRLLHYMEVHYAEKLSSDRLASVLHIGHTKLYALCQQRYHQTPMQLVTEIRMKAAMELLSTTGEPIGTISQAVGYEDQNYFTKAFRRATGQTPSAWRKGLR